MSKDAEETEARIVKLLRLTAQELRQMANAGCARYDRQL